LQVPGPFLARLHCRDTIHFRDARDAHRSLRIVKVDGKCCWAEMNQTAYFVPGMELQVDLSEDSHRTSTKQSKGRIGPIPPRLQVLLLKPGETLIVNRSDKPGRPASRDEKGRVTSPAQIGISLPNFLEHAKAGEPIWFDDGKIGGVITSLNAKSLHVKITQARPEGEKLGEAKGINLPDTRIDMPALTAEDIDHLKFVVEHADLVGYSFVRSEDDVRQLLAHLPDFGGESLGVVLKIETREAFENLPGLLLAAMEMRAVGVMIARGDLAVECGYQRLAEVQEEVLWICEAAHVPVIWATQVLESLSKRGIPSRSEITDAAMGERAECVMLNKGPYVIQAVKALDDILTRMQSHQEKKRSMLRRLRVASSFTAASGSSYTPLSTAAERIAL
jgi:pyruvate kinase